MTDFTALGLSVPVMDALESEGFKTATKIQARTIPFLLDGRDVVGLAQTGSGKTGAFVLPMIERLLNHEERPKSGMPRALILAPTRELAIQITDAVKTFSRNTKLRNCTIFGGAPYRTQTHILRRGVDILVATPGRLLDHMKQGNIYLDEVEYFVLDEADRMLDMGFVDDVTKISANIRREHQSVMFSATLNDKIKDLASTLLKNPEHVEITPEATVADNLIHKVMFVARHDKHELLFHMIEEKRVSKALIFVRTKKEADELAEIMLEKGYLVDAIHGDKQQRQRERIIRSFRSDKIDFLVATDVAARGIDVKDIDHVFNIDVPIEAESYVHRIGRTARGGKSGEAYTFCSKGEFNLLQAIERLIKMRIEIDHDHPFPQQPNPKKGKAKVRPRPGGPRTDRAEASGKKRKDRKDRTPLHKQSKHRKGQSAAGKASGKPGKSRPAKGKSDQGKPTKGKPARSGKPMAKSARPKKSGGGFDTLKRRA
ncbi:DEAD/DEAH box helicase [Kordiimonas lipolytica]|uniref:DEAD/DEAH box helicase n=1 Tax=Kordiimonas lipolytica TaxID=1662421 RepID=A0ABV8U6K8_9PROT|nr:DEAD/DEAH box helicase [Kordiimonas lipolytica]